MDTSIAPPPQVPDFLRVHRYVPFFPSGVHHKQIRHSSRRGWVRAHITTQFAREKR